MTLTVKRLSASGIRREGCQGRVLTPGSIDARLHKRYSVAHMFPCRTLSYLSRENRGSIDNEARSTAHGIVVPTVKHVLPKVSHEPVEQERVTSYGRMTVPLHEWDERV